MLLSPNILQNLIRGHIQMNSWSTNENATGKFLTVTLFIIASQT